jgi:hypothetical protein
MPWYSMVWREMCACHHRNCDTLWFGMVWCDMTGTEEKQSSCWFQAKTQESLVSENLMFNGPRAMINMKSVNQPAAAQAATLPRCAAQSVCDRRTAVVLVLAN